MGTTPVFEIVFPPPASTSYIQRSKCADDLLQVLHDTLHLFFPMLYLDIILLLINQPGLRLRPT